MHQEALGVAHATEPALANGAADALNFTTRDALALTTHAAVRAAAASALLPESIAWAPALEAALGALLRQAAVRVFPTDEGAAYSTMAALVGVADYVVIDQFAQGALARAASAATCKVMLHDHLDTGHVRELLARIRLRDTRHTILVVTEGLFESDAAAPDLPLLQHICREYSATLVVDVTHDLGVLGPDGAGSVGEQALWGKVDIVLGCFAQHCAAHGSFVAGAARLIEGQPGLCAETQRRAHPWPPVQAAGVLAALRIISSTEGAALRSMLLRNAVMLRAECGAADLRCLGVAAPMVVVALVSAAHAQLAGQMLARAGVAVEVITFPDLAPGGARLRLQLKAAHQPAALVQAARQLSLAVRAAAAILQLQLQLQLPAPAARWRAERQRG